MNPRPLFQISNWLPHLAALAALLLCARLAIWQLDRAEEKEQRLQQWQTAPAMTLDPESPPPLFATVSTVGSFDAERHVLLDNQIRNSHPGVHVFTPFRPSNSETIYMVNRGWQPWDRNAAQAPTFTAPQGLTAITARVSDAPRVGLQLGEAAPLDSTSWPNLMTYYDSQRIREALGTKVADEVLLLDPNHPAHLSGDEWARVNMGPERHLGYAFQWASIGLAIFLIWLVLTYRKFRRS
ncbi:MAG: SURF1 family protein [Wenzhouxiangella sp.]|jgi:cytochrome oxidase assembly protein ShyY1|nr:SURF1 family protein [Wenzhouxiangella sp.]